MTWTKDQQTAIDTYGQDTLVSAAAGSGKTAVLVERIIRKIIDKNINIDEMLVVTFTNASAKEMRERIHARLINEVKDNPTEHLKRQLVKIHQAEISTLHRFCLNLIEKYYYTIDLDPTFRTGNDEEMSLLLMQAIDDVMEDAYHNLDSNQLKLILHLTNERSDATLRQLLESMYYYAIANSNPSHWLNQIKATYKNANVTDDNFKRLASLVNSELEQALQLIRRAETYCISEAFDKTLSYLQEIYEALTMPEDLTVQFECIQHLTIGRKPAVKSKDDPEAKLMNDLITADIKQVKAIVTNLQGLLYAHPNEMAQDIQAMYGEVEALTGLVKHVIDRFGQLKRERKVIDFSDYEHFALQILLNNNEPTEIARYLREHYHEILIDEYQDTNRVQESIIQAIKQHPESQGNLFMVGDVKQSIYKFRQAEPELFLQKYAAFKRDNTGKVIELSQNFRSRLSVIDDTNAIFERIMDETVGDINYDDSQKLYYGAPYDEARQSTEMKLINKEALDIENPESHYIARRIKEIVNSEQVYDVKLQRYRKATYKDIAILERSFSNAVSHMQVMKHNHIPFHVSSKEGYFKTDEVETIMSFLRVIDNPLQDIPLAGVLRSIIYQFTANELAMIRRMDTSVYLYQNLRQYKAAGDDEVLLVKVNQVLSDIEDYRNRQQSMRVSDLIRYIYEDTHFIEKYLMLAGGLQREANLKKIISLADHFEQSSYRGLFQFIRYIDNMLSHQKDFGEVNIISDEADVVRMMTVHASKGLEFPFVIYSGLNKQFNFRDTQSELLIDQRMGLAMHYFDERANASFPLMLNGVFKHDLKRSQISEELRLMYVAFTRAREKLILVGTVKNEETIEQYRNVAMTDKLDVFYRMNATTPLSFILPAILQHQAPLQIPIEIITSISDEGDVASDVNEVEQSASADFLEALKDYQYAYTEDFLLPTKESVSEIKKLEAEDDLTTWTYVNQFKLGRKTYDRPKFISEEKKTAQEIGTLMHLVMQQLPQKVLSRSELNAFIQQLVEKGLINAGDVRYINIDHILQFMAEPIFQYMIQAEEIYHELPFVIGKQYLVDAHPDQLVQGMIDCVFKYQGNYYLLDYKTDKVIQRLGRSTEATIKAMAQKYEIQMKYYKKALETVLDAPVIAYLYFFEGGLVEVNV
ncbi:helicase-exonuclease AddAB subunit AddA [Macrococcoides caseolyticum]|uniref:helicase-exonuclease AddAB subunit AddA n=1 Tax=Macrococcoides caseolyticum TaxID=69966 RepID=UPI001F328AB4|nr:helicase-exonuclease AddAB subunit AddA [Macrococcus caseolyticus]